MKAIAFVTILFAACGPLLADESVPAPWRNQDIGSATIPGKANYADGVFVLQGTMDIWGQADGCEFVSQPVKGDFAIVARAVAMENPGGIGHAKASLCFRASLDPGAANVTLCATAADGTQFNYRSETGGNTVRVFADAEALKAMVPKGQYPCWLKLVREGKQFVGYESADGEKWVVSGQIDLDLPQEGVIGLAASSHKPDVLAKVTFDHVTLTAGGTTAKSQEDRDRESVLTSICIDGTDQRVVYRTGERIEAPNWSPDGKWLVFNSKGSLWRIAADGSGKPELISTGDVKRINNDHVLSPDGKTIYFSAGGHLYAVPFEGGQARRVSNEQDPKRKFQHFLHGISPDGKTLAYVGAELAGDDPFGRLNLYTIPAAGGPDTRLTNTSAPNDGPEFSSDGKWIYFNSEMKADVPGHAQCFRMAPDGTGIEQLTHDERVNWFPHVSPDRNWVVYISFPPGTIKHPPNKDVILRRMKADGSGQSDIVAFNGGQGTINVNSWSPDSRHFAYVAYPKAGR